jgi:hypothetical protein
MTEQKKVKPLIYFLLLIWVINIAVWSYVFVSGAVSFEPSFLFSLSPLIIIPFVVIGLRSLKKWGLMLGYFLSLVLVASGVLSLNVISLIIWAYVLYFLYKNRKIFS